MKNKESGGKVLSVLIKHKYALLVVLVGIIVILLPTGSFSSRQQTESENGAYEKAADFSLYEQERRISEALSKIEGAGAVTVLLTLKSSAEQVPAYDRKSVDKTGDMSGQSNESAETTVVITAGSQQQSSIALKYIYPEYLGALVVAEGAESDGVRLALLNAVSGLTGLGADKITVTKMKNS